MNRDALQLLSRFAFSPNQLGYCGLDSASQNFTKCVISGNCDHVTEEIPHFKGLNPYLKTIAQLTNLDIFDYQVIEAYWLGNELLSQFKPSDYDILIKNFQEQGLPEVFIEDVSSNKPNTFIPLHLFNILHIGVGKITGSVATTIDSINNCMIRWGEITKIENNNLTVDLNQIKISQQYDLETVTQSFDFLPEWLPDLKTGDTIAVHWKWPTKILTTQETKNLSHWTNQLLKAL